MEAFELEKMFLIIFYLAGSENLNQAFNFNLEKKTNKAVPVVPTLIIATSETKALYIMNTVGGCILHTKYIEYIVVACTSYLGNFLHVLTYKKFHTHLLFEGIYELFIFVHFAII